MTKHYKYSKRLHWATLCCFLFPFFYTGCGGPSSEEIAAKEKYKQDSTAAVVAANAANTPKDTLNKTMTESADTTAQNYFSQVETSKNQTQSLLAETPKTNMAKETRMSSEKISDKFTFLKPFLTPKINTYTGIATVIDSITYIEYFSVFLSFLILIICLVIKFIEITATKTIVLLDTLGLIFLFISQPLPFLSIGAEILWGFWVAVTFVFVLTIYDFYSIILNKRLTNELQIKEKAAHNIT